MIKCVFFDFDGTLLNSLKPNMLAFSCVFRKFGKTVDYKKLFRFFGERPILIVKYFFPEANRLIIKKIVGLKDKVYAKSFVRESKLFNGVIPFLNFLNESKIYTGLISQTPKRFLLKYLKKYKIKNYFSIIVGNNEVKSGKREDMFLKACSKLKIKANQAVYIADSVYDAKASKKAKIRFFGVATGGASRKDLLKYSVNVFNSINDAFTYFKNKI